MSDLCDPLDNSPPGSSALGFFRQEYWSGLPFPPPRNLPWLSDWTLVSGVSCTVSRFFTTEPLGKPSVLYLFFFSFFLNHVECGIRPGIKPIPYAVEVLSHIHWTAREVPYSVFLMPSSSLGLNIYLGWISKETCCIYMGPWILDITVVVGQKILYIL